MLKRVFFCFSPTEFYKVENCIKNFFYVKNISFLEKKISMERKILIKCSWKLLELFYLFENILIRLGMWVEQFEIQSLQKWFWQICFDPHNQFSTSKPSKFSHNSTQFESNKIFPSKLFDKGFSTVKTEFKRIFSQFLFDIFKLKCVELRRIN